MEREKTETRVHTHLVFRPTKLRYHATRINPFRAPEPLSILVPSTFPPNGFPVIKGVQNVSRCCSLYTYLYTVGLIIIVYQKSVLGEVESALTLLEPPKNPPYTTSKYCVPTNGFPIVKASK